MNRFCLSDKVAYALLAIAPWIVTVCLSPAFPTWQDAAAGVGMCWFVISPLVTLFIIPQYFRPDKSVEPPMAKLADPRYNSVSAIKERT